MPNCNCTKTPFTPDPPCFGVCAAKILGHAEFEDLTALFGLPPDLCRKIIDSPSRFTAISLESYLRPKDISIIREAFAHTSQSRLDTFWRSKRTAAAALMDQLHASLSQGERVLLDKIFRLAGFAPQHEKQTFPSIFKS